VALSLINHQDFRSHQTQAYYPGYPVAGDRHASKSSKGWARVAHRDDSSLLDEEPALLHAACKGDRNAFAILVERYWDRLYRWLIHLAHDRHTAEDLTQEAFLKAFAGMKLFRDGSNFRAWLFRIAHNCFVNLQRKGSTRKGQTLADDVPDRDDGPVEQVLSREAMKALARAVGQLPDDFRSAFLLRAEEGMSFRQIAEVLDLTEETARWRVFKARQKLLTGMAGQLDGERT
jgi:RNA polymerase sigma-70 factor (ECF subfamily)